MCLTAEGVWTELSQAQKNGSLDVVLGLGVPSIPFYNNYFKAGMRQILSTLPQLNSA